MAASGSVHLASVTDAAGMREFGFDAAFNRISKAVNGIYNKNLTYNYVQSGVKGRFTGFSLDNAINSAYSCDEYGRLNGDNIM